MAQPGRYHHGDLHATLLREAALLLREQGVEVLSLRRLAERAGVSRTAPYHASRTRTPCSAPSPRTASAGWTG